MILDTDQDIQQRFSDLLDGKLTEEILLAFGCRRVTEDDGFFKETIYSNEESASTSRWLIDYKGITKTLMVTERHNYAYNTYMMIAEVSGKKYCDSSHSSWYTGFYVRAYSMRDILDFIDEELLFYHDHPEEDCRTKEYQQKIEAINKAELKGYWDTEMEDDFVRMYEYI